MEWSPLHEHGKQFDVKCAELRHGRSMSVSFIQGRPLLYEEVLWGNETGIIPVKNSHTSLTHLRIKPLALASDHGHYITVTPERALVSVGGWPLQIYNRYKFVTVSLPERLRSVRFITETAVWRFQKRNGHLDPEVIYTLCAKGYPKQETCDPGQK